jgi:hypothetical protein
MIIEDFQRQEILVLFNNNLLTKENRGRGVYHYIIFNEKDGMTYEVLRNEIIKKDKSKKLLYKDAESHEDATPL